jgi:hypothetical protein
VPAPRFIGFFALLLLVVAQHAAPFPSLGSHFGFCTRIHNFAQTSLAISIDAKKLCDYRARRLNREA